VAGDGNFGHLEGDVATVANDFAPILISFSRRLDSDFDRARLRTARGSCSPASRCLRQAYSCDE
jgi:hypothetical protein